MQMASSRCLLLLSTRTPAGSASAIAGITSESPNIPKASLLPVSSYSLHPSSTGVIRSPAMKRIRATIKSVNSLLMICLNKNFPGAVELMVVEYNVIRRDNPFEWP